MLLYKTKKEVTQSLPQHKLLPTKQGDYMILLKPLKVNSNLQVFKFTLFNKKSFISLAISSPSIIYFIHKQPLFYFFLIIRISKKVVYFNFNRQNDLDNL